MIIKLTTVTSGIMGTYGVLSLPGMPICVTLELPWKDNQYKISCIPEGVYEVKRDKSPSKNKQVNGDVFRLLGVPNRQDILIHIGNWTKDTEGCILVGETFGDGMILNSVKAMQKLLNIAPDVFTLEVRRSFK